MTFSPIFTRNQGPLATFLPILLFCTLLAGVPDAALAATKMLMLNPVRAIFTDRQRSVNISVNNPSEESITYTISLVTMRKDENGKLFEPETETEEEKLIKSLIRFSPRRATIDPAKRQVVKLMVRKPKDLPPGEYQTRLRFSLQPLGKNSASPAPDNAGGGSMINLDVIVDSTIPIIIQHGGLSSEVTPLSMSLKAFPKAPAGIAAEAAFARSGNGSAFGDVFIYLIPADDPKGIREIGRSQGLAIYIPETERKIMVPLTGITREELTSGTTIRIAYRPSTGTVKKRQRQVQARVKDFTLP